MYQAWDCVMKKKKGVWLGVCPCAQAASVTTHVNKSSPCQLFFPRRASDVTRVGAAWFMNHRVLTITQTFRGWNNDSLWTLRAAEEIRFSLELYTKNMSSSFWRRALKRVMPASSATLITAELGRIVAVSSSNQTTSAARLNWLIAQPMLARRTLK